MHNILALLYAVLVSFVLTSAGRNLRDLRPNGPAIERAGRVAFSASVTLALLLTGWAALYALGFVTTLPLAEG
jgi:hypothetical protein